MPDPVAQLVAVGVARAAAAAYVALIDRPDEPPAAETVEQLVELGLVTSSSQGDVRALPPRWAIGSLVRRRREELMAEDARLTATVVAAEDLQAVFEHAAERRGGAPLIEVLHGHRAADSTVAQLMTTATRSLLSMQPGPTVDPQHEANPWDLEALARGVAMRTLYSPSFLAEPGALRMVRDLVAAGEQARVHDDLPTVMLLFDGETVLLPTDRDGHPSQGAAVIRSSSVVQVCEALFERCWQRGTPFDAVAATGPDAVPGLLLAGFSDERIARELGVSVRTVRRRIRDLMTTHGAASRVQLGAALTRSADRDG